MKLVRTSKGDDGIFGAILDENDHQLCVNVELPWRDNHPQTSCIPVGTYTFYKYTSPKHGEVWITEDVPDRTNIEMHAANFASELLGCIGVGETVGYIGGKKAVLNSQETLAMLRLVLPDKFDLTVEESYPTGP